MKSNLDSQNILCADALRKLTQNVSAFAQPIWSDKCKSDLTERNVWANVHAQK